MAGQAGRAAFSSSPEGSQLLPRESRGFLVSRCMLWHRRLAYQACRPEAGMVLRRRGELPAAAAQSAPAVSFSLPPSPALRGRAAWPLRHTGHWGLCLSLLLRKRLSVYTLG